MFRSLSRIFFNSVLWLKGAKRSISLVLGAPSDTVDCGKTVEKVEKRASSDLTLMDILQKLWPQTAARQNIAGSVSQKTSAIIPYVIREESHTTRVPEGSS